MYTLRRWKKFGSSRGFISGSAVADKYIFNWQKSLGYICKINFTSIIAIIFRANLTEWHTVQVTLSNDPRPTILPLYWQLQYTKWYGCTVVLGTFLCRSQDTSHVYIYGNYHLSCFRRMCNYKTKSPNSDAKRKEVVVDDVSSTYNSCNFLKLDHIISSEPDIFLNFDTKMNSEISN